MNLFEAIEPIRTVGDLIEWTRTCESPITADLLQSALHFFMEDCRSITPKSAFWKAIKERQKLGLRFQLMPEHEITPDICAALRTWMLHPQYGREIGASFLDAMLSQTTGGISDPRGFAFDIIVLLQFRYMLSHADFPDEEITHLYQWNLARRYAANPIRECATAMIEMYRAHLLVTIRYYDETIEREKP